MNNITQEWKCRRCGQKVDMVGELIDEIIRLREYEWKYKKLEK